MLNRRSILTASIAAALGRLAPSLPAAELSNSVELDCDIRPLQNAIAAARNMLKNGTLDIVDIIKLRDLFESGSISTTHSIVRQYKTTVIVRPSEAFLAILQNPGRNVIASLSKDCSISQVAPDDTKAKSSADAYLALVAAMSR